MKFSIWSWLLLLSSVFLAGCGQPIVGTYVSEKGTHKYLELRKDGTFFLQEGAGFHGKYQVNGKTITFESAAMDEKPTATIEGKIIVDSDGERWTKK